MTRNRPDYRHSILNLAVSIQKGLGGASKYAALRELPPARVAHAKKVLLVVIDGLGYEWLMSRAPRNSFLKRHVKRRLTSVFPSTTATAMTTLYTGEPPARHGLTGWFMFFRELGMVIAPLLPATRSGGLFVPQADAEQLLCTTPLFGKVRARSLQVIPSGFMANPYNAFLSRHARILPYNSFTGWLRQTRKALRLPRKFIFSYWPHFDTLFHEGGASGALERQFLALDAGLSRLARSLPKGTLLVVTADHGLAEKRHVIKIEEHPTLRACLALPLTGERRMAYAYVKPGKERQFAAYVTKRLGHACVLRRSSDLIAEGWFGPGKPCPELPYRVGDYCLLMKEGWLIQDTLLAEERKDHKGNHGGVSKEELFVPLIIFEKR